MTASRQPKARIAAFFEWMSGSARPEPAEVRALLVANMLARRKVQFFAHLSVIAAAVTAGIITGAAWCFAWAAADLALLVLRLRLYGAAEHARLSGRPVNYPVLMLSATAWAVLIAAGFAACVLTGEPVPTLIAGVNVAGIVGGVSSRNASTPRFGIFLILLIGTPFTIALMLSPIPGLGLASVQVPLLLAGMCMVTQQNYLNLSALYRAEYSNRMQALTDALTGLGNRMQLRQTLARYATLLDSAPRDPARAFAVLCLDLDGFKGVNDGFGHGTGDALLQAVAGRLRLALRHDDIVCRIGGDEFVVVIAEAGPAAIERVATRIIAALQAPFAFADVGEVTIGVSIGSALAPADGTDPKRLLLRADEALYSAKRAGKGVHRRYGAEHPAGGAAAPKAVRGGRWIGGDGSPALS
jgi:diguanylate cyclase (GGDEF)-like protein